VKFHAPEGLPAHDVLQPEQGRLHGPKIRGHVINLGDAPIIQRSPLNVVDLDTREQSRRAATLDEVELHIAERCRDRKRGATSALVRSRSDVAGGRCAIPLERGQCLSRVGHLEHQRPDPIGVPGQIAARTSVIVAGRRASDERVASTKQPRALPIFPLVVDAAPTHLPESHVLGKKAARAFEFSHEVLKTE
jgi:hypothetical protein